MLTLRLDGCPDVLAAYFILGRAKPLLSLFSQQVVEARISIGIAGQVL